ncbi:SAVED domain-containing protein, partial [Streptomyces sp. SID6013]|nr:SAVED domain-containing protein [Streptomyces sp. SID6013]
SDTRCDYDAPDRLLRLAPSRTLADKKQSNLLQPSGENEIVRDLLMHRVEQRKPAIHSQNRAFTIRVQTRPAPFAMDAGEDDLHIRIRAASDGRLPLREGLQLLQTTLPLTSDAVYAAGARTVRVVGGAHLSVALAVGAALPETKIGILEAVDTRGAQWTSAEGGDDPLTSQLHTQPVDLEQAQTSDSHDRIAIFLSLTANPDRTAFEQLLRESSEGFVAAAVISVAGEDRLDPREAARLSTAAAQQIKALAAHSGRAEVHLAFHGPYTMALLVGRYLNTLRTIVYEWDSATPGRPRYTPALVLEPGVTGGPITEVLLDR